MLLAVWPVFRGRERNVYAQLECVIENPRHQFPQQVGRCFDRWVCVDLDQPGLEILIDHEIESEQLEDSG